MAQALIVSPAAMVLWNQAGPAMLQTALPIDWADAFALCLFIKVLSLGDIIPLLCGEPTKPRRTRARTKNTEKNR